MLSKLVYFTVISLCFGTHYFNGVMSINFKSISRKYLTTISSCTWKSSVPKISSVRRFSMQSDSLWSVDTVRKEFVSYFVAKHNHDNIISSPCVPVNDPTLLFTNAGMNQFKPIFIGTVDPSSPLFTVKRAVNSQKCIRAGGKHNDLDDVGKDTYHHTFFEMLGTWSFGDYFKKEAIEWAYDILVNKYQLNPDRLYASYFGGDESMGLPCDTEARDIWLRFLPAERVLPFDKKANFWEMGDTGPCGPCSEIHYDRIGGRDASKLVNADDPDVIEIWNLVFIQFNREPSGDLRQLPNKHIDTGMGLERLTSILQDKRSNYDTDAFMPIFRQIQKVIGCDPYTGKLGADDAAQNYRDTAYRVLADHARTLSFAIADGAVPSNEGRGYVLRRILRRAVRYGMQTLGGKPGFFSEIIPVVAQTMGGAFPEIIEKQKEIILIVREEESSFSNLLEKGVKYLNELISSGGIVNGEISGEQAFFLYDSLGFPLDLTQIMAAENGLRVDTQGFQDAMNIQKTRSRLATRSKRLAGRTALNLGAEQVAFLQSQGIVPTVDSSKYSWDRSLDSTIEAVFTAEAGFLDGSDNTSNEGIETVGIVLSATSFYAEAGGQVPDSGVLTVSLANGQKATLEVLDVQIFGGYVLHTCSMVDVSSSDDDSFIPAHLIKRNAPVSVQVDYHRRRKVAPNHTMTHVLNYALRKALPENTIDQKGSLVNEEKLRFDFSLNRGLQLDELQAVEETVNKVILNELAVDSKVVPLKEASGIAGLRAVFGEVYPDPVRVVSVGPAVNDLVSNPTLEDWQSYSVEFCGGTHISNTREAKAFVILEETAVAKGIRRISAVTGDDAILAVETAVVLEKEAQSLVDRLKELRDGIDIDTTLLAAIDEDVIGLRQRLDSLVVSQVVKNKVRNLVEGLQRDVGSLKNQAMMKSVDRVAKMVRETVRSLYAAGQRTAVLQADVGSDAKAIKRVIEEIKKEAPDLSYLCVSEDGSDTTTDRKVTVFAVVTDDGQKVTGIKANDWISLALRAVGGKGGGKSGLAQGSAVISSSSNNLATILDEANRYLQVNVSK